MVFHFRQDNGVSFLQVRTAPAVGDEVDAFRGAAGDDDPFGVVAFFQLGSAGFVALCCFTGQRVNRTVNVGIGMGVIGAHGVEDNLRLLGGGSVVEVDQRVAVDLALQNGELVANVQTLTSSIRTPNAPSSGFAFLQPTPDW